MVRVAFGVAEGGGQMLIRSILTISSYLACHMAPRAGLPSIFAFCDKIKIQK